MEIKSIQIDGFRGVDSVTITPAKLTFITGPSGAGKSSIIIHFHDTDYYAQHMHNCFDGSEKFVTDQGVRAFNEFKDGDKVRVLNKHGKWAKATVRHYDEKQRLQKVTLIAGRTTRVVLCTTDHRWILEDHTVTTQLQAGDRLCLLPELSDEIFIDTPEKAKAFCLGFVIGDGTDTEYGVRVRLCGDKIKYADIFRTAGFNVTQPGQFEGDFCAIKKGSVKQKFLNEKLWTALTPIQKRVLFMGYYAADGSKDANRITTADKRIENMIWVRCQ